MRVGLLAHARTQLGFPVNNTSFKNDRVDLNKAPSELPSCARDPLVVSILNMRKESPCSVDSVERVTALALCVRSVFNYPNLEPIGDSALNETSSDTDWLVHIGIQLAPISHTRDRSVVSHLSR